MQARTKTRLVALFIVFAVAPVVAVVSASWIHVKGGAWEPDASVMARLQADIPAYVKAQASERGTTLRPWDEYRFQYQGRVEDEQRIVYVNAFCHTTQVEHLDTQFVVVLDGGACFFNALYDPAKRRFLDVRFNGMG